MSLATVLAKLEKDYKDAFVDVDLATLDDNYSRYHLQSPNINHILGGSWVDGKIYHFWGKESSAKTLMSMRIAKDIQLRDKKNVVIFVDFEKTFSLKFYKTLFPTFDFSKKKFIYVDPADGEEGFDIVEELLKTGEIGLVIWDSVAVTPSKSQMGGDYGKCVGPDTSIDFIIDE